MQSELNHVAGLIEGEGQFDGWAPGAIDAPLGERRHLSVLEASHLSRDVVQVKVRQSFHTPEETRHSPGCIPSTVLVQNLRQQQTAN